MLKIIPAHTGDLTIIQSIAHLTWPITFSDILSKPQIDYMLEMMYSLDSLKNQINQKQHKFKLAKSGEDFLGFLSYEINFQGSCKTKIHKIYILPLAQGKGVGKLLIQAAMDAARKADNSFLYLNVNKYNTRAISFYERFGFYEDFREDIPIGNGFLMEDVVMELKL